MTKAKHCCKRCYRPTQRRDPRCAQRHRTLKKKPLLAESCALPNVISDKNKRPNSQITVTGVQHRSPIVQKRKVEVWSLGRSPSHTPKQKRSGVDPLKAKPRATKSTFEYCEPSHEGGGRPPIIADLVMMLLMMMEYC